MKNSSQFISQILAAGAAGVALFALANAPFVAALPGDAILAFAISAAAIGLAIYDYSRRVQPVTRPCRVLRPLVPCSTPRSAASGLKSVRKDRIAA
jgi:hypothetical protein